MEINERIISKLTTTARITNECINNPESTHNENGENGSGMKVEISSKCTQRKWVDANERLIFLAKMLAFCMSP